MGYTPQQLLARLQELGIAFQYYEHPVVMTVEEQAKYIGHVEGGHSKNLFLKDKKNRLYIISALTSTKIDLKLLSQRLGLGKSGLRMAPEETLKEVLQVPLGCVTPFALFNESARSVALLLDNGFRRQKTCLFHPLANNLTIALTPNDLDKFLQSIGNEEPAYVDLEAVIPVGKDHQPDLAVHVPSEATLFSDVHLEKESGKVLLKAEDGDIAKPQNQVAEDKKSNKHRGKGTVNEKESSQSCETSIVGNVAEVVSQILDKARISVLSEVTTDAITKHGKDLGPVVAEGISKRLASDLESVIMTFKNRSYTEGFIAGRMSS
eukprot:TRINITY_DN14912_c0_g1_i1.p1 TRINITY_DN14912_c0_g1~~TRINITY_DN14912_c0_g1_i1.p1  ORF type:complete len:321 (-),score=71.05 TRINITY_DN14912_c0_g1_i1:128-1090(-)